MDDVERDLIIETLGHTLGNRTHAATILGISIRALRNKLRDYAARASRCRRPPPARPDAHMAGVADLLPASASCRASVATRRAATSGWRSASWRCCRCWSCRCRRSCSISASRCRSPPSVLVLMVALFLNRPLDFSSFPTLLLLTTLLRLSLNVATTRLILSHGNEGPLAAGHVVAAFGGFLMGGDVVIGLILFCILLVVNFMVITKGSGRIAEVAARFSLDAMPGKQMAIDADMSAGLIDEKTARRRRRDLEEESGFYGAMDGAAKFVRGDAIAGLIITVINILGGLAIGMIRHGMAFADAVATFTTLTRGRRAGRANPRAAGLHRRRHRGDQGRHRGHAPTPRWSASWAATRSRWRWRPARRPCWRCCLACRRCRSWRWPGWPAARPGCASNTLRLRRTPRRAAPIATRAADHRIAAHGHDPAGAWLRAAGAGRRRRRRG